MCRSAVSGPLVRPFASAGPTLMLTGGPMLNGKYQGGDIGSGTMVWKFSEEVRGGRMTWPDFFDAEAGQSRSHGHCMTMGTASTMASMA